MREPGVREETILHGMGVSIGVAHGPAYLITSDTPRIRRRAIDEREIAEEIARFETGVERARAEIERVRDALLQAENADEAAIFDAHLLILEDAHLKGGTLARIADARINAEFAFASLVREYMERLAESPDSYLRERTRDMREVEQRVLRALLGEREQAVGDLMQNAVLLAHDLPASLTAELDRDRILGFATEVGAPNSHTAILARALEIPAVLDVGPFLARVEHGDPVIVDGREGLLIIHPSDEALAEYDRVRAKIERKRAEWVSLADAPSVTADGERLTFLANIEFPREVNPALAFGCEGIGLYRTEYLFLQSGGDASESEQYDVYRGIVERMKGRPVTIRTIDLGGDKLLSGMEAEDNPFLGWRAIRYSLDRPAVFEAQLRAVLKAGAHGPVSILLPMVSTIGEAEAAREHLESAIKVLAEEGIPHDEACPIGVLVETPAAALMADELAGRFDFLSLGTNDLIQYVLAVDRGNRRVAHLYQPFHPAVLELIARVIAAAETAGIELTICGEMGSNTRAAALLLGLGVRRFSMVPARIPRIKQVLSRIAIEEAREMARDALAARSADGVRQVIDERFRDRFRHGSSEREA